MGEPLRTPQEAAAYLHISKKTLTAHVRAGEIHWIDVGRGTKKPRRMFAESDLEAFVEHRKRKAVQCQSTGRKARRSTNSTSNGEVIAFTALRSERAAAKRKP